MNRAPSIAKCLILLLTLFAFINAQAAELKLEVRLIWGSNEAKSPNEKHKPVDPETAKKLGKVFKWKYYYDVKKLNESVPNRGTKRIKISEKCDIEITEMEGANVEVKMYGEGKLINKSIKALNKGESFVLAGDDKNDCAWFIIITLLEEKR